MPPDHYALLEVPRDASDAAIKKAYHRLARKFHPDRTGNDPTCAEAMKAINLAYDLLSDPKRRASYDELLKQTAQQAQSASAPKHEGFRVELDETKVIVQSFGNNLIDLVAKTGRRRIDSKVNVGKRGGRVLDELAALGTEAGRAKLAELLKKIS